MWICFLSGPAVTVARMSDHRAAYGLAADFDPFERIEADTLALAAVADGRFALPVAGCPGWSVADLVWHLLEVQQFWGTIVAGRVRDPAGIPRPDRPTDDAELLPPLRSATARLVEALRLADPDEPVWTWAARKDAGWVARHQVQEAAVHRWDAEQAAGRDVPLHPTAAADGVDEFLQISTPFPVEGAEPLGGRLQLMAVDVGLAWSIEEDAGGAVRCERTAAGDAAAVVSGSASDLLLYLYRRRPTTALEVAGDVDVAERFAQRNSTD
jgi:uncharacterized protein (TIGR03083 family)